MTTDHALPLWQRTDFEHTLGHLLNCRTKTARSPDGLTVAAVLLALFNRDGEPHVLLTKRSEEVEHHKGEISFPGGKKDSTDDSLLHCALRETEEEVGVDPRHVRLAGELDDFYTVATLFVVTPFVGYIPYPYRFRPSAREIAEVLTVPLRIFFDPSRRNEETWHIKGEPVEIVSYRWKGHSIWGATAFS
jgi:8-oxo-dGTP pyrophosphatase MutT (NUDIX family)